MLKPYTLEMYQKDPESAKRVVYRDGSKPQFICVRSRSKEFPFTSVYQNGDSYNHTIAGNYTTNYLGPFDLLIDVPDEITEGWINVYNKGNGGIYSSKEMADVCAVSNRLACLHITYNHTTGQPTIEKV
jgi:hypothetical protein